MELSLDTITAPGGTPSRWALFLHGILGTRANWRVFARRLVQARPDLGAVLPDLRNHGRSQGAPAPHTLDAVAEDLALLAARHGGRFHLAVGHSYGAKAALALLRRDASLVERLVLVDASPGARTDPAGSALVLEVLGALKAVQGERFASREAFLAALASRGFGGALGQWLAMNLGPLEGGLSLVVQVPRIEAMLADYFPTDLWGVIDPPPGALRVHFLAGGRSGALSEADRSRVRSLASEHPGRVTLELFPEAGHWVQVDAPEAVAQSLLRAVNG
ncbi:MAG: alpha/beta hydrolase [Deltaproteobacteria bacterium]|nr:alpha/beta hydrolase [Deltaproteobacteria bacterium]